MFRSAIIALFFFILTMPSLLIADDKLAVLEAVVAASKQAQPDLQNYLAIVETSRIEEMMAQLKGWEIPRINLNVVNVLSGSFLTIEKSHYLFME